MAEITTASAVAETVKLTTNLEYRENLNKLLELRAVYDGDPEVLRDPRYLIKHELELKKDGIKKYMTRVGRTYPHNFADPIVSTWQDLFMKGEPVVPDQVNELFNGYENDVDGKGNTFITYLETEMLRDRFVYGNPTTLVDAPVNQARNAQEERELGIRPFLIPIDRLSLVDWSIEKASTQRSGLYNFLTYQYRAHKPRFKHTDADAVLWYRRSIYRANGLVWSQVYSSDKPHSDEWTPEGPPVLIEGFTEIPARTMLGAESWISDVSTQCLKHMNLESMLDNILYYQGYRHVFVAADIKPEDRARLNEFTMVILPRDSNVISIPAENPQALLARLADTEAQIWRFALQQIRQLPSSSKAAQSADTMRTEREPTLNMVKRNIRQFEMFANQIVGVIAEYNGITDFPHEVTFSRDIDQTDIEQTVTVLSTLSRYMSKLPTLRKEIIKQLVQSLNFRYEVMQQITEEIEAIPDEDMDDNRLQATVAQVFRTGQQATEESANNGSIAEENAQNGGQNQDAA